MQAEKNAQQVVALWPSLPIYDRSHVASLSGRSDAWALLTFPVLDQVMSFSIERIAELELPPACSVSLAWGQDQGQLHIDGCWLNDLCLKVGLSGVEQGDWLQTRVPLREFLLRWLLAGLLDRLHALFGSDPQFGVGTTPSAIAGSVRLALRVQSSEGAGQPYIWLDLPEAMAARLPREPLDESGAFWWRVPFIASLQAGYQALQLDQLASLACGDIVLLRKPLEDLQLVLPSCQQADVRIDDKEGYVVTNSWYFDERREVSVDSINAQADDAGDDMLDQMSVQLVCEVGRVSMTLSELKALKAGGVLPMARRTQQSVDLMVNGLKIGQGELVRLDDTLGVRVTRLAKSNG